MSVIGLYVAWRGDVGCISIQGFVSEGAAGGGRVTGVPRPKRNSTEDPKGGRTSWGPPGAPSCEAPALDLPCFLEVEGLDSVLPAGLSICLDKAGIPCPPGPCLHHSAPDAHLCQQVAVGDKDPGSQEGISFWDS